MSAYIVSKEHIDYLIRAGLDLPKRMSYNDVLRWTVPHEERTTDYERGEAWGMTAIQTYKDHLRELSIETSASVGQMLIRENHLSVCHRYDENPKVEAVDPYEFERSRKPLDPVQVLKAINCYEYQSCEHPDWEDSEANRFCESLRNTAIHVLPGYEEADWEIGS